MTGAEKEKHFFENHMMDLCHRAERTAYPIFTDFLTSGERVILEGMRQRIKSMSNGTELRFFGGHEDCTHAVAGFFPKEYEFTGYEVFPVSCICIERKDTRYAAAPSHRDYLGAILNLGMERSMIGDIRIRDRKAFLFCKDEMVSYILEHLCMVRNASVSCFPVTDVCDIPAQEYEIFNRSVASPRLDNLVAAITGKARSKAADLIGQGKVFVDSAECTSTKFICKNHCIVTVRGSGKFRLEFMENSFTAKGRMKVQIYKYM